MALYVRVTCYRLCTLTGGLTSGRTVGYIVVGSDQKEIRRCL